MALVELESVSKDYPMGKVSVHALRKLSLSVDRGKLAVLLGPSGCGKTTILNLIGGLDRPSSGRITVGGEEISRYDERHMTAYRRGRVGFIFQFFNLLPTLTAAENVEFSLALLDGRRAARERSRELLALVGLSDRADHFPSELSGGEQQRVAIARALANRPSVLLCDEPTGNLDVGTGVQVLSAIRDLNRTQGTTVLIVTHNSAIAPFSDLIVRLHDGAINSVDRVDTPCDVTELSW